VKGGYSIPQALQAATLTNARLLAMDDLIGSIQPGKLADVIVVDGRPDLDIDALQGCDGVQGWPHDGEGRRGRHPPHVPVPLPRPSPAEKP
jgi:imidazolonepropionase-like amidohydrolase